VPLVDPVDAEPAQAHIRELMAGGMSMNAISSRPGLKPTNVYQVMRGQGKYGPPAMISRRISDAILAVELPPKMPAQPGPRRSGLSAEARTIGSRRRIQALLWMRQARAGISYRSNCDSADAKLDSCPRAVGRK
jgi:hypothetical protein